MAGIFDHDGEVAGKQSVVGVDADAAQADAGLLGDDGGDVGDDADVVVPHYAEGDGVLRALALACPPCLDNAVAEACMQFGRIGAVAAVNLDAAIDTDEAEHVVAIDGIAALGQLEVNAFQVLVDDEHVFLAPVLVGLRGGEVVALRAAILYLVVAVAVALLLFQVAVDDVVHVQCAVGNALVELGDHLEAHALDEAHHGTVVVVYLAVAEFSFQRLFGKVVLACGHFLQGLAYLGACLGGGDEVQPVLLGRLGGRGHHFHLVAALQQVAQGHVLAVDLGARAPASQAGVDVEGKVEHGSPLGQLEQVAFGGEHKHLVFIQLQLEAVHGLQVVVRTLQCFAHGGEPFIQSAFPLDAFVSPVSGQSALGNVVHALGAYLHLHPLAFGPHDGDVQRLVAVALGHGKPVAQAFRVRLVHVRHYGVHLPALLLLLFGCGVEDDADGKQVVHPLEGALLLLHLLVDGVDGLGASLDVELQSGLLQLPPYGGDEGGYVAVARGLGLVQLVLDVVVHVVLGVLQREVFQLRLQLVQSQLVGQRGVEVGGLACHFAACLVVGAVPYLPHHVDAVGYHDEDDAHVLGQREQQVAEVFRLHRGAFGIQGIDADKPADDACHVLAEVFGCLRGGVGAVLHGVVQHQAQYGGPPHANLVGHDDSCLHILDDGVQPEHVALYGIVLYGIDEQIFQFAAIVFAQRFSR